MFSREGVAERSNAAVSKTVGIQAPRESNLPPSPPLYKPEKYPFYEELGLQLSASRKRDPPTRPLVDS